MMEFSTTMRPKPAFRPVPEYVLPFSTDNILGSLGKVQMRFRRWLPRTGCMVFPLHFSTRFPARIQPAELGTY